MKIVAEKYRHKTATTREALQDFVKNQSKKDGHRSGKYQWYLHIFDTMRYLEQTPRIDLASLAIAMAHIKQSSGNSSSEMPQNIAEARYSSYKTFLKKSKLLELVARAVDCPDNYNGLSSAQLLEVVDGLVAMNNQLDSVFPVEAENGYSGWVNPKRKKALRTRAQKQFFEVLDRNIKGAIRKAEQIALADGEPLQKMVALYHLYNPVKPNYSDDRSRANYLEEIENAEQRRKYISGLAEDGAFWPKDVFEHVKAFAFAKNSFLDDKEQEDRILNRILDKLEKTQASKKKTDCLHTLLDLRLRAPYAGSRDRLFGIYVEDVFAKIGKDDGTKQYQKRLAIHLKALEKGKKKDWDVGEKDKEGLLSNTIGSADKYLLLRRLSDAILSQEQTSKMLKASCQIKLNSDDMMRSYLYGIGVDYLTSEMDQDAVMANRFIQFLNSKGEGKDCNDISAYIQDTAKKRYAGWQDRLQDVLDSTKPANCKILHENFWSAPLEARAVIIARMLKSAVKDAEKQSRCSSCI